MAPTPSSKCNLPTPSAKLGLVHHQSKTPMSRQRLNFTKETGAAAAPDHPVEVIGRIRDHPDHKTKNLSAIQIDADGKSMRVKTEIGYRDFSLDGISFSQEQDLDGFYRKYVESRINGVKLGQKCTIMMYGPTGSGKSHTMFGCSKQPGIVYNALKDILGEVEEENGEKIMGFGTFVQVTVLEIYNEEIYDLLSSSSSTGAGFTFGWHKNGFGSNSKVKLEVMGKKAKNASSISGNEAGKIMKEIQNVEKRRIVKSTRCNERSSRSHCLIIVDVPTVGGRLMLVDMAGSENIEQAGQNGLEAKMQTAKINQGNIALKRVVESIANGDSHVPFRDSKLTMLLQDSFEDDKSKILMILCASPDPKELHKTIATFEYGAKAKCIVRGPHTPEREKGVEDSSSAVILGSRIAALDQFICKLQMENKLKEKERNEAHKELQRKEEEISMLRAKLAVAEERGLQASEQKINLKVNERTLILNAELERKIQECQVMANEFVEKEGLKMEERISQQQQELEKLRQRLEDIESKLRLPSDLNKSVENEGGTFMKRLMEACSEDSDMVKSMDLSKSIDMETNVIFKAEILRGGSTLSGHFYPNEGIVPTKTCLTTVYEEEEYENDDDKDNASDEEVQKEVIEEKRAIVTPDLLSQCPAKLVNRETESAASSRQQRIQNIFNLCGNYRELSQSQHNVIDHTASGNRMEDNDSLNDPMKTCKEEFGDSNISKYLLLRENPTTNDSNEEVQEFDNLSESAAMLSNLKENQKPLEEGCDNINVHVKWEASKENPGKFIASLSIAKHSTLADLRKLIDNHLDSDHQAFTFLALGDPSGCPVPKDKEASMQSSELPICNKQQRDHLACLRPTNIRGSVTGPTHTPFTPLENKIGRSNANAMKKTSLDGFSPDMFENLGSTPFITLRRHMRS